MAYDSYTLETITVPAGTLTLTLEVDDSLPALTKPSHTITDISPFIERVDVESNRVELESVTLKCAEDYSTHATGFWFNAVENYPGLPIRLKVVITSSAVDYCLFYGYLIREETYWGEPYVSGTTYVRDVSMKFVSGLSGLKDIDIDDLLDEAVTHGSDIESDTTGEGTPDDTFTFVSLRAIFASAMKLLFGGSYSIESVVVDNPDILFHPDLSYGVTEITYPDDGVNPMDCLVMLRIRGGSPGSYTYSWYGLGDVADSTSFHSLGNAYELIRSVSQAFGYMPRYFYGNVDGSYTATGKDHRLRLVTRGRSSQQVTSPGSIIRSKLYSGGSAVADIKVVSPGDHEQLDSYYREGEFFYLQDQRSVGILTGGMDVDVEIPCVFYVGYGDGIEVEGSYSLFAELHAHCLYTENDSEARRMQDAGYYDYATSAWLKWYPHSDYFITEHATYNDNANYLSMALCKYWINRATISARKYDRLYSSLNTTLVNDGVNIVTNGSFEYAVGGFPSDWTANALGGSTVAWETSDSHTGDYCVSLTGASTMDYAAVERMVSGDSGNTYTLSLWAKAASGTPTIKVLWGANEKASFNLTTSWAEYTAEFTGTAATFRIYTHTSGVEVWVDDVELRLKAGAVIPKVTLLDVIEINDGIAATDYYATEVEQDVMNNQTRVVWTEV